MNILTYESCKFYLKADLIISPFRSDIGVPCWSQKQPPEVFFKRAVLKIFALFTGKHLCWCLFFDKIPRLKACSFIKKDTNTGVFLLILQSF